MEYTQLGRTDLRVSRIAFGTWSFGGEWGPVQVQDSERAIRAALDIGIDFFDTAQAYGFQQTAPAADIHLTTEDLAQIGRITREAVRIGGPSPEAMP